MNKTDHRKIEADNNALCVSAETLAAILDCGKATARKVGAEAGARIQIGSRVLYRTDRIKTYLDSISEI